jgi:hypothetical protein
MNGRAWTSQSPPFIRANPPTQIFRTQLS